MTKLELQILLLARAAHMACQLAGSAQSLLCLVIAVAPRLWFGLVSPLPPLFKDKFLLCVALSLNIRNVGLCAGT